MDEIKEWQKELMPWAVPEGLVTRRLLVAGLRALGVAEGDCILPHIGFKSFGLFAGGVRVFTEALIDLVGPEGTILMPASSGDVSDPRQWRYPPLPAELAEDVAADIPVFDPVLSPTRGLSAVAEYFRTYPGSLRSSHPSSSFAARGKLAQWLVGEHGLHYRYGLNTPLGRFCETDGLVLVLGSRWYAISLFNHVEYHMPANIPETKRVPVMQDGRKVWVDCQDIAYPHYWYEAGMQFLIDSGIARRTMIGPADCTAFRAKQAVAALAEWRLANGHVNEP